MRPSFVSLLTALIHLTVVSAQLTTLYIPGFGPQPISADVAGVDAEGNTTWILQPGELSGTLTELGFFGTATLVEGADGASITYVPPGGPFTMGIDCTFSDGLAICNDGTNTETGTISPFEVQVGTTAPAAETSPPNPDTPNGSDPAPSGPASSPSKTDTSGGTSATGPASDDNFGHVILPSIAIVMGSAIVGIVMA